MLYDIGTFQSVKGIGQLETWDDVVIKATSGYHWTIGSKIQELLVSTPGKRYFIMTVKDQSKRNQALSNGPSIKR